MGIQHPIVSEIARGTYLINEFGMTNVYVLVGNKRGLVLDAGCGMSDIRQIVEKLCPHEYDVVLSHAHGDHVGGMDRWDRVYIHPADMPALRDLEGIRKMMAGYPAMMKPAGTFEAYDISPEQLRLPRRVPDLLPLEDGQVFDLGSRRVGVLHTPGHTRGEVVLIDERERLLLSADACNPNLLLFGGTPQTAHEGLLKIQDMRSLFDRNFNSHVGYGRDTTVRCLPDRVLDDCLELTRRLAEGTALVEHEPSRFLPGQPEAAFARFGLVRITLNDSGEE